MNIVLRLKRYKCGHGTNYWCVTSVVHHSKTGFENKRQADKKKEGTYYQCPSIPTMASTHRSSFRRMPSFGEMFKVRKTKGYQHWEAEDDPLMSNSEPALLLGEGDTPATHFREENNSPDYDGSFEPASGGPWISEILAECFYLGSYDMAGLSIRGRGCIDYPAGYVWQQTQQSDSVSSKSSGAGGNKPRRKNSWSPRQKYESATLRGFTRSTGGASSHTASTSTQCSSSEYSTRYVRLVAGHEELEILDNHTREKVNSFNYRKISFVGTHPKYTRLFAFVAETPEKKAYCHAFKCESKESADKTACGLSDVFQKKIKEIQAKKQQTIEITASATVVD